MSGEAEMHSEALFAWSKVMSHVTFILKGQKGEGEDCSSRWISPLASAVSWCWDAPRAGGRSTTAIWWVWRTIPFLTQSYCIFFHLSGPSAPLWRTGHNPWNTRASHHQFQPIRHLPRPACWRGSEPQEPPPMMSVEHQAHLWLQTGESSLLLCLTCYSACVTAEACVTPLMLWKHPFVRGEVCWSPQRTMAHLAVTDSPEYLVPIKAWSQVSDALSGGSYIKSCLYSMENELRARPSPG